jgi:hypothetical protein
MTEVKAKTWFQRFAAQAVMTGSYLPVWGLAGQAGRFIEAHPKAAKLILQRLTLPHC